MSAVNRKGTRLITFGQRLRAERERLGLSQSAFGDLCGVGKNAQINYEGDKRSPDGVYLMAAAGAGADVLFIVTGERSAASMSPVLLNSISHQLAEPSDYAPIPVYSAELAAGDGAHNTAESVIDHLAFRRAWLRSLGISPSSAVIARAWGDSMAPTLQHGDVVLIDSARADPPSKIRGAEDKRPAPIFALLDDSRARIKRIELASPGVLMLLSDNPAAPPEVRPASAVKILGKVMWWGHTNWDQV